MLEKLKRIPDSSWEQKEDGSIAGQAVVEVGSHRVLVEIAFLPKGNDDWGWSATCLGFHIQGESLCGFGIYALLRVIAAHALQQEMGAGDKPLRAVPVGGALKGRQVNLSMSFRATPAN